MLTTARGRDILLFVMGRVDPESETAISRRAKKEFPILEEALDELGREETTADVEQDAAPGEAGAGRDPDGGDDPGGGSGGAGGRRVGREDRWREELEEGLSAVEESGSVAGFDRDARGALSQDISFRGRLRIGRGTHGDGSSLDFGRRAGGGTEWIATQEGWTSRIAAKARLRMSQT